MCNKQALLLNELRSRLVIAGFSAIDFHIINTVNATNEYHKLKQISPDIPVHQEQEGEKIFEKFGADKDHILVADRCNRLTYQVIMPWSILHYPYVKAAILSTYQDDPCGKCQVKNIINSSEEDSSEEQLVKFNATSNVFENNTKLNLTSQEDFSGENITQILVTENSTEATTIPIIFQQSAENFSTTANVSDSLENQLFRPENLLTVNKTDNTTEDSLEIPLSWSTHIDHSLLNKKNNYGNDIEHSLVDLENDTKNNSDGIEISNPVNVTTVLNKTTEAYPGFDNYVTHRSPAIDEILEVEWNGNDKHNMYWKKHKIGKKIKHKNSKKVETINSQSTTPIPIRIIFRNSHDHSEDDSKSDYIVLKTDDPNYHGHLDGKSYFYKDDNKISKESHEAKTVIPGRFDVNGNTEEAVTDSIPWYDDEPVFYHNENEIQKSEESGEVESEKNLAASERSFVAEEELKSQSSKNETDDKLVSHYSKLLYWVNYPV